MDTTWIITANASRVRIFSEAGNGGRLQEVKDMVDDRVRMRAMETQTDQPVDPKAASGSINNTGGALPGSTYQPAKTPASMKRKSSHAKSALNCSRPITSSVSRIWC